MNNKYKYSIIALAITLCAGFFASCDDDDDQGGADRLFRPQVTKTTVGGTYFTTEWDRYEGASHFDLQLSVDSFKTILQEAQTDTIVYTFEGLDYDTEYQYRIRSVGNSGIQSEYFVAKDVKTVDFPTYLQSPSDMDVIDTEVRVKWIYADYDELKVYDSDNELLDVIEVTDEDNLNKELIVGHLEPSKTYRIMAYKDGNYQGKRTYKTAASQEFTGDVIDLRELSDEENYSIITPEYVAALATDHPNGVTVILKGGTTYNIAKEISIASDVTFITGLSLKGYAEMAIDNSFVVPSGASVDNIRFEKVFFTEGVTKSKTSSNFGGTYVFNFNKSGAALGKLTLENCIIKYKRGVIRMQTQVTIDEITMNNCVVDSIGGYGVINNGNDASYIGDIKVANSTFSHAEKLFVGGKALGINSISLEKITTCYAPKGASYILDYNGNAVPGGISVKSSVFGPGWGSDVHGMRSKASNIIVDRNYRTNDLTWIIPEGGTEPTAPMDLETLNLSATELFKNPDISDFTVTDERIKDKMGDPRWW